jgi:hypothetical protein
LRAPSAALGLGAAAALAAAGASAHRLDEYLQAARIALEPEGVVVQLDLTPGVAVAGPVVGAIDSDGSGSLSPDEQRAYASQVLRGLQVTLGGEPLSLRLTSFTFPDPPSLRRGEGTIRLEARAAVPALAPGPHRVSFRNGHQARRSAYLANALLPVSARVTVTGQRRSRDQSELTIDYTVAACCVGGGGG